MKLVGVALLVTALAGCTVEARKGQDPGALTGGVSTRQFRSQALGTTKHYVVYLPPSYTLDRQRRYPVVYYLHGLDGNETDWTAKGHIDKTLDSLIATGLPEMILVMPDGDDSWYTTWNFLGDYAGCRKQQPPHRKTESVDDYCVPWPHYDDYIARDLVAHVDSTYRTTPDKRHRGIAGLSMGGNGAISLAIAYPDVFSAAASHSGVLTPLLIGYDSATKRSRYATDMKQIETQYSYIWPSTRLAFGKDTLGWWARDPGRRALSRAVRVDFPAMYIDVGVEDPYLNQSRAFRDALESVQLRPEYHERSGAHTWPYWQANAVHSLTFLARRLTR
ncbi:MAG TPA: alpha/beta hydrolase family protein [Gemmatimonadaceae bacterium]|nr:alpha/beta hydrolase family protein [Gemmatimonadaceae bacterium]